MKHTLFSKETGLRLYLSREAQRAAGLTVLKLVCLAPLTLQHACPTAPTAREHL